MYTARQLSGWNSSEIKACFVCYFVESPSLALSIRAIALGDWAFYLSAASSHLPWKSRLFPPYVSMFSQASPVCSALSKFHYGMAGSTRRCSLRLSAWHVTVSNTRDTGGCIPPAWKNTKQLHTNGRYLTFIAELGCGNIWRFLKDVQG